MIDVGDETLELLTVPEVAKLLRLSKSTIWRLVSSGDLKSVKQGRSRRIAPEDLADYRDRLRGLDGAQPAA
jgi:excisionase family DNA binding protein